MKQGHSTDDRVKDNGRLRPFLIRGSVFMLYAMVVAYASIVPVQYRELPWEEAVQRFSEIRDLNLSLRNRADWLANLGIFIPVGFLGTAALCALSRSILWRLMAVLITILSGSALAIGIEFLQLWFPPRTVSQNDIKAEIIGVSIGTILVLLMPLAQKMSFIIRRKARVNQPLVNLGGLYLAIFAVASLAPYDFVLNSSEMRQKLSSGRVTLIPFTDTQPELLGLLKLALHAATYVPIGAWLASRLSHRRTFARTIIAASGCGIAIVGLVELGQLFVYTRHASTTGLFSGGLGCVLGSLFVALKMTRPADRALRSPRWRPSPTAWRLASLFISACVMAIMWAPFIVASKAQQEERQAGLLRPPFAAYYYLPEFAALSSIVLKGLPFLLLGISLHLSFVSGGKSVSTRLGFVVCCSWLIVLALAVEAGQVYFESYQPDGTDVLIYTSFGMIGLALCSYVRNRQSTVAWKWIAS